MQRMKVVILLKNGRQETNECTYAYPVGDKVNIGRVLHYADGRNAIDNCSIIGSIIHVELMDCNLEGYEYLEDGKKIGVIRAGSIVKEEAND